MKGERRVARRREVDDPKEEMSREPLAHGGRRGRNRLDALDRSHVAASVGLYGIEGLGRQVAWSRITARGSYERADAGG